MCLRNAKKIEPAGDITCYKVVVPFVNKKDGDRIDYSSPYQSRKKWVLGKMSTIGKRNHPEIYRMEDDKTMVIYRGAYHSFVNKLDAINFCKHYYATSLVVLECIIPKDSKYVYEGEFTTWTCTYKSYASHKLKPIREVFRNQEITLNYSEF